MRGPHEFAEQLLRHEISWEEVPKHLLSAVKEIYNKMVAEIGDAEESDVNIPESDVIMNSSHRW
jgi:hypothetical protein